MPPVSQDCAVGICFGLTDPNEFYQLKIQPVAGSKQAKITVVDKNSKIVSEFELAFETNKWQQIQIALKDGYIEISLAGNEPVKIQTARKITGGIGLLLEGEITAYFDNIHVRKITHKNRQEQ